MNRKVLFVFLVLVFTAAIIAVLTHLPEESVEPQPTPMPAVWDYFEALDFARANCREIAEPLEENVEILNSQSEKLLTLSGTMELSSFRSRGWPLEGRESCWIVLAGGVGQVFNSLDSDDPLAPGVVPVGPATLIFEDESGNVIVLMVNDGPLAEPTPIVGGVG